MADTGPLLVVAAALIDAHGYVLVQQRPPGKSLEGLWEFPGGKLEPGEAPAVALVRELAEELAIVVDAADLHPIAFADEDLGSRPLIMLLYLIRRWRGTPVALEASALAWYLPDQLSDLAMPPADGPLTTLLQLHLKQASDA